MCEVNLWQRPLRLQADNFTPPQRTPWGGRRILEKLKAGVALDPVKAAYSVVGESWELSVDPAFPSHIVEGQERRPLPEVLAAWGEALLGRRHLARWGASTPLLIKSLDAADRLSLQVHPPEGHRLLAPHESGKFEVWIILEAEPGAGIYLGLHPGTSPEALRACLAKGEDPGALCPFVPVKSGDIYAIEPGTLHAIGAGVTLLEPQLTVPGKSGVTYRVWDWGRRYDACGRPSAQGRLRDLHVEASLEVIDFSGQAVAPLGRMAPADVAASPTQGLLFARHGLYCQRVSGTGALALDLPGVMVAVVVLAGALQWGDASGGERFVVGEAFLLAAAMRTAHLDLDGADSLWLWVA